ncbi:MAG: hypothetical protein KGJ06_03430 [Pseudomonadota bacterium]|nr:hypothetical protein [Pseudomonadota bacterium]
MFTIHFDGNHEINGVRVAGDYSQQVKSLQTALNELLVKAVRAADDGARKEVSLPVLEKALQDIISHVNEANQKIVGPEFRSHARFENLAGYGNPDKSTHRTRRPGNSPRITHQEILDRIAKSDEENRGR